jgi:serine/threonine-protein kinase
MSFEIGDTVGDYEIVALLGAGGMGKVYKARNVITERVDALKVLLPDLAEDPGLADRFIREIKVLASLNHPNIAGLRTAFRSGNQLLMVMEYVEGTTLDARIKQGPVPIHDAVDYISQALAALDYAHKHGIVHRDIKPANMMLTPDKVIKLMDFGIAKSKSDRSLTQTGTAVGSLLYMSPEQAKGGELDGRSDLYSVGISLYELVTGGRPFQGNSDFEIMLAQLQTAPVPPIERVPSLPRALNDAILTSLEKDPAHRFQDAAAFRAALAKLSPTPDVSRLETSDHQAIPSNSAVPAVTSPPSGARPETTTVKKQPLYKFIVPVLLAAAVVTALVLFLHHAHAPTKSSPAAANASSPAINTPTRPTTLSLASGDIVFVEGGEALLGTTPKHVSVGGFYIDKTEVSNRAFLEFCDATGHALPPGIKSSVSDNPVVNVTVDEARSFCGWAGKRLPRAEEWEKAARGAQGQPYPWGVSFDYSLANLPRDDGVAAAAKLAPVTAYDAGKSPYGALNMLGNVWEWVDAPASAPQGDEFRMYQRMFRDLVPPLTPSEPFYYARGGSYKFVDNNPAELISDPGSPLPARARKPDVGFRCAMDVKN